MLWIAVVLEISGVECRVKSAFAKSLCVHAECRNIAMQIRTNKNSGGQAARLQLPTADYGTVMTGVCRERVLEVDCDFEIVWCVLWDCNLRLYRLVPGVELGDLKWAETLELKSVSDLRGAEVTLVCVTMHLDS